MITCGRCTKDNKFTTDGAPVKHGTVTEVRDCYAAPTSLVAQALEALQEEEARAEIAAELRSEQWWENRGADDGFDEWEQSRGVLSFADAWDASDRAQGLEFSTRTGDRIM